MAVALVKSDRIGVAIEARAESKGRIPGWFGEAVLYGKYWLESGLVEYLSEEVRVERGRMGQYEVVDFVLLLNSYAISGERTLRDFFKSLAPVGAALMSAWGRLQCPSASSLSRFLAAVGAGAVESLRRLFESDLGRNGLRVIGGIGVFDRVGDHYTVFDVDGTVSAVRQRRMRIDENYPTVRRRSGESCAPGYKGRKRGEVIRNRTTVAQAQTSEWLGTYGSAGNGDAKRELARSCGVIKEYLVGQGLNVAHGLVRLDGLYGEARMVSVVQGAGLGYVLRCRDYHLLKHPVIAERMQSAAEWDWQRMDEYSFTQWFDLGYIEDLQRGYATPMRVVVLRTPVKLHQARVGKRVQDYVYELFLTSQSCASLSGKDVIELYRGRGGFEQRLSEEDREQDYDRWCSWRSEGQEFWQILGQWSWNWRVWMGWQQGGQIRQTVWAEGEEGEPLEMASPLAEPAKEPELTPSLMFLQQWRSRQLGSGSDSVSDSVPKSNSTPESVPEPESEPVPKPASELVPESVSKSESELVSESVPEPKTRTDDLPATYGPMMVATEWGRGLGRGTRFSNEDFRIINDEQVLCPAGHPMFCRSSKVKGNGDMAMQFGINPKTCQQCPVKRRCLAPHSKGVGGRRVTVIRKVVNPPATELDPCSALVRSVLEWVVRSAPKYEVPIYWYDVAATQLRRRWHEDLARQAVEIKVIAGRPKNKDEPQQPLLSRSQRSHYRLSWWERWERNERQSGEESWQVILYGSQTTIQGLYKLIRRSFSKTG